jgi:hypothetical protein
MSSPEERRSFLLSMTLTELALILFFLLLLLTVFQLKRKDEDIQKKDQVIRDLIGEDPRLISVLPEVSNWVKEFEDEDFKNLKRRIQRDPRTERQWDEQVSGLTSENKDLVALNEYLQLKINSSTGGRDHPPCWVNPDTLKVDYIYRVILRESDLAVEPAWPVHRANDIDKIPGGRLLESASMSLREFSRAAAPILAWSKAQKPECRHYVIMIEKAESIDEYNKKRFKVEEFFYKYEQRR